MSNILESIKGIFSKKEVNALEDNSVMLFAPAADFIPYACHYDQDTVLTKNGELLQTIRIVGLSHEIIGDRKASMRETIRRAISEKFLSDEISVYFHTIRKRVNLDSNPKFPSFMQDQLHKSWVYQNSWNKRFVNELYITILHKGMSIDVNWKNFPKMFMSSSVIKEHDEALKRNFSALTKIVEMLLSELQEYGAMKLKIQYDENVGYYSQLVSFFSNIIQLEKERIPVKAQDISKQLSQYKVAFGGDALEVKKGEKKIFASMLSIKDCSNISDRSIDKFLQIPQQLVITQTINFVDPNTALHRFSYQDYVLGVSGDKEFANISGLNSIVEEKENLKPTSFCESQTTIMVIADDLELLSSNVKEAAQRLNGFGVGVIKEDINSENCFWSQLPGNFSYLVRRKTCLSKKSANFASLYNFPFGSLKSKWGEYVTLLKTNLGTTYFFNFHVQDNGHSIIIGDTFSGKKTLLNFLLAESSKFNPKILHLDSFNESELFIKAIGGIYKTFSLNADENQLKLNPLLLEDTKGNKEYLKYWFLYLLDKYSDPTDIDHYMEAIDAAIVKIYEVDKAERRLSNVSKFFVDSKFKSLNKNIIEALKIWYGEGKYAHVFNNDTDDLLINTNHTVFSADMTAVYDTPMSVNLPIVNYILYYFRRYCTGEKPSIMAVADGNRTFNSIYYEKNLPYILDDLQKANSIMIVTASFNSETVNWSGVVGEIYNKKMATKMFLSSGSSLGNVDTIFKFSEEERMYLEAFDVGTRDFIIRQGDVSMVSSMDLGNFETSLGILCNDKKMLKHANSLIKTYGESPDNWVPKLYDLESDSI